MMERFRIIDHPADVGFEAFGATLPKLFANAGCALTELRVDLASVHPQRSVGLRVEGADRPGLLVNWLSEILYLEDAESWLFCEFNLTEISETALAAVARGEPFDRGRHQLKSLVKAVTYHQLAVAKDGGVWRARVFVDV